MPSDFDVNTDAVRGIAQVVADPDAQPPHWVDPANPGFQTSESISYWTSQTARKIAQLTALDDELYDKLQASLEYVRRGDDAASQAADDWQRQS